MVFENTSLQRNFNASILEIRCFISSVSSCNLDSIKIEWDCMLRDQIDRILALANKNQKAVWFFSLIIGVFFYFVYLSAKNLWATCIWNYKDFVLSLIKPDSNANIIIFTITLNMITDIPAALFASIFCGTLMIYVLRKQRLSRYLGAIISFFLLDLSRWHFWNAPDIGVLVSSFLGPFLASSVFIFTVWLLVKFRVLYRIGGIALE